MLVGFLWQRLTQAVQKQHGLGNGRAAVCALFSVQYFALLPHTPLEAQLRHNPPSQLVLVNGTAVERKGRQRQGLVVVLRNAFNPRNKRPPHPALASASASASAYASAYASRNHSVVRKQLLKSQRPGAKAAQLYLRSQ